VTGILALLLCAYLAAVYLAWESPDELREKFRRRAMVTWLVAGMVSLGTLALTRLEAPRLWSGLTSWPAALVVVAGTLLAPVSFMALRQRRFQLARVSGAAQVGVLLVGWAMAQWPYLIYPTFTLSSSAAPRETIVLVLWTLPFGLGVLIPSLWFLFAVFKPRSTGREAGQS
jgi:cytochrome d ubiquinol oxidase subunit II